MELTPAQKLWFTLHILKDKEVYKAFALPKQEDAEVSDSNTLIEDIELQLGRKLTKEEISRVAPVSFHNDPYDEVDIIEPVNR